MTEIQPFFSQLRSLVIVPVLQKLATVIPSIDTPAARNLMLGTAAQESGGKFLAQWPTGPAVSFWQVEPASAEDLQVNFLQYQHALDEQIGAFWISGFAVDGYVQAGNLYHACAVARTLYYRIKEPLPAPSDIRGLGQYWKTYYNTGAGGGTVDEFVSNFSNLIGVPPDA
jgi:hypothetical protein